jgi:hypothetical protein
MRIALVERTIALDKLYSLGVKGVQLLPRCYKKVIGLLH